MARKGRTRRPTKNLSPAVLAALRALGRQGGKARARNLTKKQRSAAARKAARARWRGRAQ